VGHDQLRVCASTERPRLERRKALAALVFGVVACCELCDDVADAFRCIGSSGISSRLFFLFSGISRRRY
jgi:hypothetical protein